VRTTRLYYPGSLDCGKQIKLDQTASNHLVRVLRTRVGEKLVLFNGDGFDYACTTLNEHAKKTCVSIDQKITLTNESPLDTTLIQGLSRHDRMETSIQKCIELGISRIIPVMLTRSNVRLASDKQDKKLTHWERVAISACEQCGRSRVPEIYAVQTLETLPGLLVPASARIMFAPEAKYTLDEIAPANNTIEFIIGPEGGMTEDEEQQLAAMQFCAVRFGPRILRTETAGPASLAVIQSRWGDLSNNASE
jgi:16S rRNA (uracil1498-N3)-methyltransferase